VGRIADCVLQQIKSSFMRTHFYSGLDISSAWYSAANSHQLLPKN